MAHTLHIFASLGNLKKLPAGGGQTSARRLVNVLKAVGYHVNVVNRSVPAFASDKITSKIYKYYGFIVDPFRYFLHLLFKSRKDAACLVIGYSGNLFPFYFLFVRIGKLLGFKTIIYVKGGFTEKKYHSFSQHLKNSYKKGLQNTDLAYYEGEEGSIISNKKWPYTQSLWLPNYVESGFAPETLPIKKNDVIRFLYFGRIHNSKNILMVIDIFDNICKKINNSSLTIVGSGIPEYEKLVEKRISISPNKDNISRISRTSHEYLKNILMLNHFFVFPSIEEQEGHSNSLNEAMSFGLVPIVSDNNFLPSIVGNNRLVARDMTVESFTNIIIDVLDSGDYDTLSSEMYLRVKHNFTQSVVEKKLKDTINSL